MIKAIGHIGSLVLKAAAKPTTIGVIMRDMVVAAFFCSMIKLQIKGTVNSNIITADKKGAKSHSPLVVKRQRITIENTESKMANIFLSIVL